MRTSEDLRRAFRAEPLPSAGLDPAPLVSRGRRRRAKVRALVGVVGSLAVGGILVVVQPGLPVGTEPVRPNPQQPAGPGAERPATPLPSLAPDGPIPNTYGNAVSLAYVACMQGRGHDLILAFPGEFVDEDGRAVVEWDAPEEEYRAPGYNQDDVECLVLAEASVPSPTG